MLISEVQHIKKCEGKIELFLSAVYFLCRDDEPVYIGSTTSLKERLVPHRKNIKFNGVYYIPCSPKRLRGIEKEYIQIFNPIHNKLYTDRFQYVMCEYMDGDKIIRKRKWG
jgi:hypothetical protein